MMNFNDELFRFSLPAPPSVMERLAELDHDEKIKVIAEFNELLANGNSSVLIDATNVTLNSYEVHISKFQVNEYSFSLGYHIDEEISPFVADFWKSTYINVDFL